MRPVYREAMKQYPDDMMWIRWDKCYHCRGDPAVHVNGKCLFATTTYYLEEFYAEKCIISHSLNGTVVHLRGSGRQPRGIKKGP